jgi:hypothetical protein
LASNDETNQRRLSAAGGYDVIVSILGSDNGKVAGVSEAVRVLVIVILVYL